MRDLLFLTEDEKHIEKIATDILGVYKKNFIIRDIFSDFLILCIEYNVLNVKGLHQRSIKALDYNIRIFVLSICNFHVNVKFNVDMHVPLKKFLKLTVD